MKKLMAIASAALCGAVMASGIESANVVGYATRPVDQGFTVNTATFIDAGSTDDTIALESIKVIDGLGSQQEAIQVLGTNGRMTGVNYYWLSETIDFMPDGWYDDAWNPVTGVTLKKGEGIIFYSKGADAKLSIAGQVVKGEQRVTLNAGFTVAGNSSNNDLDLQDLKLENTLGSQQEAIQVLGTNGRMTGVNYYWLSEAIDFMPDGWYDDAWNEITGVTVSAGEAFVIYAKSGATLVIPSQL